MKKIKKLLTIIFYLNAINFGYSQSISETKDYIIDKIKTNSFSSYKIDAFFGNQILPIDLYTLSGKTLHKDEEDRIFIIDQGLMSEGKLLIKNFWIFDVKGINSISVNRIRKANGDEYSYLVLNIKNEFINRISSLEKDGSYEIKDNNNNGKVEIAVDLSKEGYESLRKALLHLCKAYGGSPIKDGLF